MVHQKNTNQTDPTQQNTAGFCLVITENAARPQKCAFPSTSSPTSPCSRAGRVAQWGQGPCTLPQAGLCRHRGSHLACPRCPWAEPQLPVPPGPCPALSTAGAEPRTCGGSPVAEEHRVSPEAAGRQEAPRPQHTLKLSPLPSLQAPTDICPCSQLAETWHTAARTHRPRSAAPSA